MRIGITSAIPLALLLAGDACRMPPARDAPVPRFVLSGTDGTTHDVREEARKSRLTVLLFSSWHCPSQSVHDTRIRELYARYRPLGVQVFAVDSEASGSVPDDKAEAKRRGYAFPVLVDANGALARAVGAEYATESFVLDATGVVRYHGGIDSDRTRLHDDAEAYLRDTLDDLLAGKTPRIAERKTLGCALETW